MSSIRHLLLAAALAIAAVPAEAQGLAYAIGGVGGYAGWFNSGSAYHFAGGGELLAKGIAGAGLEFGLFGNPGGAIKVLSVNGVAHLARRNSRTSPYVTYGYSRFSSGEGNFNAFNFGAGIDLWAGRRAGARFEFRDHLRRDSRGSVHYFSFRAGIVLK